MLPAFSSLPYNTNQVQIDRTSASVAQQVMPNPSWPNPMQIQSQTGTINPQTAILFNNSNTHLSNGTIPMPNRSNLAPSSSFINAPNHPFPLQNGLSLLGSPGGVISHPGHPAQCSGGFSHQKLNCITTSVQGMNSVQSMNGINPSQPPGQIFGINPMNMPQYFNQNASLQSGQIYMQNPMQNVYQFVQPQMSHYAQVVPCNPLPPNNVSHAMGPQNPNFMANPQFGMVHTNGAMQAGDQNQHNFVLPTMDVNGLKHTPTTTQQLRGNSSLPIAFGSAQSQQVQQNFRPNVFMNSQGNLGKDGGIINLNSNRNDSQKQNWKRNPERDVTHSRISKTQFHHRQNAKGKFGFQKEHGAKGYNNDRARKSGVANSSNQTRVEQRRSLPLNYNEQEIQQWREERRKNYPSSVNKEKKLMESEVIERCAKLRRQQLKEILAKQVELGCEVAEIPSYYLSDSEKQVNGREANQRAMTKKERFQNKFNKRGRFRQNDRLAKKQLLADHDSCNVHDQNNRFPKKQKSADNNSSTPSTLSTRQPTLLQRLLCADIRREKTRLLQVLRFTVMNSFFNKWPKEPLRSPLVVVKQTGCNSDVVDEKCPNMGSGVSEGSNYTKIEAHEDVNDDDDNNGGGGGDDNNDNATNEHGSYVKEVAHFTSLEGSTRNETEECEEEEGEIIY
ncbi:uncharacterized protein LOC132295184 isoform X2 [Cornus florida]|uniref:uncharacterized protein LOC132295184 isoform X2 n=1 Tax=Cornus florida TaxID=4283 RepID=UPI00289E597A|nr:uncharacterized protein LOC132295184 isoform X2 [Cornus florida]